MDKRKLVATLLSSGIYFDQFGVSQSNLFIPLDFNSLTTSDGQTFFVRS